MYSLRSATDLDVQGRRDGFPLLLVNLAEYIDDGPVDFSGVIAKVAFEHTYALRLFIVDLTNSLEMRSAGALP